MTIKHDIADPVHSDGSPWYVWPEGLAHEAKRRGYDVSQGFVAFYGGPLSNFAPSTIIVEDAAYATVEHYFQSQKSPSALEREAIRTATSPEASKRLGQVCQLREDWDDHRWTVMLTGLRAKHAIPFYRQHLLGTGRAWIVEDSPTDYVWGIRDAGGGYSGRNLLGNALMVVRDELSRRD